MYLLCQIWSELTVAHTLFQIHAAPRAGIFRDYYLLVRVRAIKVLEIWRKLPWCFILVGVAAWTRLINLTEATILFWSGKVRCKHSQTFLNSVVARVNRSLWGTHYLLFFLLIGFFLQRLQPKQILLCQLSADIHWTSLLLYLTFFEGIMCAASALLLAAPTRSWTGNLTETEQIRLIPRFELARADFDHILRQARNNGGGFHSNHLRPITFGGLFDGGWYLLLVAL